MFRNNMKVYDCQQGLYLYWFNICPLLFTLYINDLLSLCSDCVVKLFADDIKVYKRIRFAEDRIVLQSVLNKICTWAVNWNVALSIEKCCYFKIGYKDNVFSYILDSNILSPCGSIFDLSVTMQSSLKASLHCSKIVSKASTRANLMLKAFLSRDLILAHGFITCVRPILDYCYPVWFLHDKCDMVQPERVQCTFTRRLFRKCHLQYATYDERLSVAWSAETAVKMPICMPCILCISYCKG